MYGRITMCKCTRSYNKETYFCLKTKLHRKKNVWNFLLHEVWFVQYDFSEFVFSDVYNLGAFFSISLKLFFIQTFMPPIKKLLFHSIGTSFFQVIGTSLVEKVSFSLTNVNKKIWDKHSRVVPVTLFKI